MTHLEVTFIMLWYKVRWEVVGNDAAKGVGESPGFNFGLFCGYDKMWLFISYFPYYFLFPGEKQKFTLRLLPPFSFQRLFQNSFHYRDSLALLKKNII